ncbi:MAG: dihydroxy-acid dehydratase [Clostridia bacterium]
MKKEYYEGIDKLHIRSALNALNIPLDKPTIAIISTQNEADLSNNTLEMVTKRVCEGVLSNGGIPKIMHVSTFCDSTIYGTEQAKYEILLRNSIANQIEMLASNKFFDAFVFVASNSIAVAGMLMGAIRINLPCIFVSGGTMAPIKSLVDEHIGYNYWYTAVGKIKNGEINIDQAKKIEQTKPLFTGIDCELYEPNSINCMLEVLGLAVSGNSTVMSYCSTRLDLAYKSGQIVLEMIKNDLTPSRIINANSLTACLVYDLTVGGSCSNILHLLAFANEIKKYWRIDTINFNTVDLLSKKIPVLFASSGNRSFVELLCDAGGVYAVLAQLSSLALINCDYLTYLNKPMSKIVFQAPIKDNKIIRTAKEAVNPTSFIRVLSGNIAQGALLKFDGKTPIFNGTAKVYENEESLTYAILDREIKKGAVIVLRNEGIQSGNGMRQIIQPMALLHGLGLDKDVAIITDARICSFYQGFAVGHITPETIANSILSIIQDGDNIEINTIKCRLTVDIKAKEISKRKTNAIGETQANSALVKRCKNISTAVEGCVEN